jgi:hypothetical protein
MTVSDSFSLLSQFVTAEAADPAPSAEPIAPGAQRALYTPTGTTGVDWGKFGVLVPVLAGSSGAGASTFTAIALDVLQQAGRCALAIDTAEPSRSGLAAAASPAGTAVIHPIPGWGVRYPWRGHSVLAQLEATHPPSRHPLHQPPAALPKIAPSQWLPPGGLRPLHVTVVDLGQHWSSPAPTPLQGPAAWLRAGASDGPHPWPVLVVRATRPSLVAAEAALARLDPWIHAGHLVPPARLVVMASPRRRRWPHGVTGAAGARVAALLDDAVFVPADRELHLGGITEQPTPPRAQAAVGELLHDWGLLTPTSAATQPTYNSRDTDGGRDRVVA